MLGTAADPLEQTPMDTSPEVLREKAREAIRAAGYTAQPADWAHGFVANTVYVEWIEKNRNPTQLHAQLATGQPSIVAFWYRESPQYLQALDWSGRVNAVDPPLLTPGMVRAGLDPQGRLAFLEAVPPQWDRGDGPVALDWKPLFAAAGLEIEKFASAPPQWTPPMAFDARAAWTGVYPRAPAIPLRVEAAAWRGKAVSFRLIGPWVLPQRAQTAPAGIPADGPSMRCLRPSSPRP